MVYFNSINKQESYVELTTKDGEKHIIPANSIIYVEDGSGMVSIKNTASRKTIGLISEEAYHKNPDEPDHYKVWGYLTDGSVYVVSENGDSGLTSSEVSQYKATMATTNIPDGVTSIGEHAYYDCLSLLDITIPSSVTTIGQSAFRVNNWTASDPENYAKMQNLLANRVVRCLATTPPSVDSITFDVDSAGVSVTYPIYVPAESVEAYKAASGWSTYADRIQAIN